MSLSLAYSQLTVTCAASGGHPTPELELYLRGNLQNATYSAASSTPTPPRGDMTAPVALRTVFKLDQLGDSERIACVLRLPRTNFSLGRTELFHKYPTKYPARFLSLPYTSVAVAHTCGPILGLNRLVAVVIVLLVTSLYSQKEPLR